MMARLKLVAAVASTIVLGLALAGAPEAFAAGRGKVLLLPFDGDGGEDARADVARLLGRKHLRVVSPKGATGDVAELTARAGAGAAAGGTVTGRGKKLRITVQIYDGGGDEIGSARFGGPGLPAAKDLRRGFWRRLGAPLQRALAESARAAAKQGRGRSRPAEPEPDLASGPIASPDRERPPPATDEVAPEPPPRAARARLSAEAARIERELGGGQPPGKVPETEPAAPPAPPPAPAPPLAAGPPRAEEQPLEPADEPDEQERAAPAPSASRSRPAPLTDETARSSQRPQDKPERTPGPRALDVAAGVFTFGRRLHFVDPVGVLTRYRLVWAPAAIAAVDWYPLAHFGAGVGAHLGVSAALEHASGITSQNGRGTDFPTTHRSLLLAAKLRLPIGPVQLVAAGGYGSDSFQIADGPIGEPRPAVPNVGYRFLRAGGELRIQLPARLSLRLAGGYRKLLELGEIASPAYFPAATGEAFDAQAMFAYGFTAGLELRLEGVFRRYRLATHAESAPPPTAAGVLDDYLGVTVGIAALLGGPGGL